MESFGKILLVVGLIVVGLGLLVMLAGRLPFLGRLPGDIFVQRGNTTFWFPIVTSVLISIVLSLVLTIISLFGRK